MASSTESSPMLKSSKKRLAKRLLNRYMFENEEVERLYEKYVFNLQQTSAGRLVGLFIALSACLSILNFVYVAHVSVRGVYYAVQCLVFIVILLFSNTKYFKHAHFPVFCYLLLAFLVCFSVFGFPIDFGPTLQPSHSPSIADGVWEVLLVVLVIYALMPIRTYIAVILGITLPVCQTVVAVVFANNYPLLLWRQVSGLLLPLFVAQLLATHLLVIRFSAFYTRAYVSKYNYPIFILMVSLVVSLSITNELV